MPAELSGEATGQQGPSDPGAGPSQRRRLTRRALLGAGEIGVVAAGGALRLPGWDGVAFHGPHQAGILSPRQTHCHLVAFDFDTRTDRGRAAALLLRWSAAAERMTRGEQVGEDIAAPGSRAADTGVARGAGPASLTVTIGFVPTFFDRVGLPSARPEALAPLPAFPDDQLDPARGGGDLFVFVQIASDDPMIALHALRTVQRLAHGEAKARWTMSGFTTSPASDGTAATHRNLMGQLDGTANPSPAEPADLARIVASDPGAPPWLVGGSYVAVRRIRMLLDHWETLPLEHREQAVGRRVADGSPLTGGGEHTPADLDGARPDCVPVIAANAHIRLASPHAHAGATMLRRGWSYYDGLRPDGAPDAGLLFLAWQSDPRTGFVPVQHRLSRGDALSRYLVHEASSLFVVPGGVAPGGYVGQALLEG